MSNETPTDTEPQIGADAGIEVDAEDEGVLDPEDRLLEAADDALFGMHGATEGSTQWRIESLQLVNWGGFDGHHPVPLHTDATLLTGASGVGKSSLLDAWTALVMPSDTRLNGASNDMTVGRARSQGQRSPLSYIRGVIDETEDSSTSQSRTVSLRGSGSDTWGAVAATFVDDRERRFTAARLYYAPRRASRTTDVVMRMITHDDALDLRALEPAVASRFAPRELRALVGGIQAYDTYAAFASRLFTRLGIGANGDGDKALRLLARIQASQPVRSVDELYKEMVLERPSTFAAADRAVEHFDELEGSYETMLTEQQKADLLDPITALHERWASGTARIDQLDAYGATREGPTPLGLWELHRRGRVLEAASAANRDARTRNVDERAALRRTADDLAAELAGVRKAHRDAGGETLDVLDAELQREQSLSTQLTERRNALARDVDPLRLDLTDAVAVEAARAEGAAYLDGWDERSRGFGEELSRIADERAPLSARRRELELDRSSLKERQGRVPRALHDIRVLLADVAGMRPEELPFLAELLDVPAEQAHWRTAIETVLGGAARQILVPSHRLRDFSAAIDRVQVPRRITFIGADLDVAPPEDGDEDRVAGKLAYRDSPFEGWVRWYVADPSRNALCVEEADGLDGPGLRVTRNGQTRSGNRGSHGRTGSGDIIGFSNAAALVAIEEETTRIEADLEALGERADELSSRRRAAEAVRDAYRALARVPFADIDVASSVRRAEELAAQRTQLLEADDALRALAERIDALAARHLAAQVDVEAAGKVRDELAAAQERLVDDEDDTNDRIAAIEQNELVDLDEATSELLENEYLLAVGPGDPDDLDQLASNLQRLRSRLADASREARDQVAAAALELHRIFAQFKERWPDPNLGASVASYPDYADLLAEIRRTGLASRRAEWQRRLADWSGQDLVPLAQSMTAAVEEIEDRLTPINDILRRLPFGDASDRLRIRMRRIPPAEVTLFQRELRELSGGAVDELSAEQIEGRFARLQSFMSPLRRRDDPRSTGDARRDLLLDVRRHVEVSAERYDPSDGRHLAWYRTLGEKSGGESQELIAFVIGAALRFRLGDELRSRPRFAPVFLDEGFVKADAEFAGRAVQAWRGLGFQLIVGAPFDKFTGLERHMDEFLEVVKNPETQRARLRRITASQAR